ncbi:MAG: hypothetical protein ABSE16_21355 [Verrucomicrobiota bacterium]|jgi:uncharacterized membrane protein
MKTKQLANVLIKILGLSQFIYAILAIVSGLLQSPPLMQGMQWQGTQWRIMLIPFAHGIVQLAIGFYLIAKSQSLTNYLFKDDDE